MSVGTNQDETSRKFWPSEWFTALDPCAPKKVTNVDTQGFVKRADVLATVERDKKSMERSKLLASLEPEPASNVNVGCVRATLRFFCVDDRDSLDFKLGCILAQVAMVDVTDVDVDLIHNVGTSEASDEDTAFIDAHILIAARTKLDMFRVHGLLTTFLKQEGNVQSALLRLGMHKNIITRLISKPRIALSSDPTDSQQQQTADNPSATFSKAKRRIMTNVIPAQRAASHGHVGIGVLLSVTAKGEAVVDSVCHGSPAHGYVLPGDIFTRIGSAEITTTPSVPFIASKLVGPEGSIVEFSVRRWDPRFEGYSELRFALPRRRTDSRHARAALVAALLNTPA